MVLVLSGARSSFTGYFSEPILGPHCPASGILAIPYPSTSQQLSLPPLGGPFKSCFVDGLADIISLPIVLPLQLYVY